MAMAYIQSIKQISIQEPLSENWFSNPIVPQATFNEGIDPDFKQFLSPLITRRMGKLFKRAIVTSAQAMGDFPVEKLDAIITGTGLGCIENTENFLISMLDNDEECLHPTDFMQSTHNTISSQIALYLKCNGYNNTYSHRGTSFDSALYDAFIQMKLGMISSALVGGHDEMTPKYHSMLCKSGYFKEGMNPGICSLSTLITTDKGDHSLGRIAAFNMLYHPSDESLRNCVKNMLSEAGVDSFDAVVTGISGDEENDKVYKKNFDTLYEGKPVLQYKQIFGECFSSSAFGWYVAANCLSRGSMPKHLICKGQPIVPKAILIHNHFQDKDHSLALLVC
jgi:3-oxoacyl-[acyl-carrier-protein] synthase II